MDSGSVVVTNIVVKGIFATMEVFGHTMNIASKIGSQANPNEVLIGQSLHSLIFSTYKNQCSKMNPIVLPHGKYEVFRL